MGPFGAVDGRDVDVEAEAAESVGVEHVVLRREPKRDDGLLARRDEFLREEVQRRGAHTTARQRRAFGVGIDLEAVAQGQEQVESLPRRERGQPRGALAEDFVDENQDLAVDVADRDRALEEEPGHLDVHELPRPEVDLFRQLQAEFVHVSRDHIVGDDLRADFPQSCSHTTSPLYIVILMRPVTVKPSNGVDEAADSNVELSTT